MSARKKEYHEGFAGVYAFFTIPEGKRYAKRMGNSARRIKAKEEIKQGLLDMQDEYDSCLADMWRAFYEDYDYSMLPHIDYPENGCMCDACLHMSWEIHPLREDFMCQCDNCAEERENLAVDFYGYLDEEYTYDDYYFNSYSSDIDYITEERRRKELPKFNRVIDEHSSHGTFPIYRFDEGGFSFPFDPEYMWQCYEENEIRIIVEEEQEMERWVNKMSSVEWYRTEDEIWDLLFEAHINSIPETNPDPFSVLPHYGKRA